MLIAKKKVLNTSFKIYKFILKKSVILRVLATYFNLFEIKYTYETLIYYDKKNKYEDEMKIWYFEIYSLKDWTFEEKIILFEEYLYKILKYLIKEYCLKNKMNYDKFLNVILYENVTVEFITKNVSKILVKSISNAMLSYYTYVKEMFDETFESKWAYYTLIDEWYILNEEKNKLFKEYKISQAERYLKNAIKKFIVQTIKEKFYWIKVKNWNNLNVDYNEENNVDENLEKEISENESDNDDININDENEDILENKNLKNSKLLNKIEKLKKQWWLKNNIQAKIEYEIYKFKTLKFEDTKKFKIIEFKKNKIKQ